MADENTGQTESAVAVADSGVESTPQASTRFASLDDVLSVEFGEAPADDGALKDADEDGDDGDDDVASEQSADESASKPEDAPAGEAQKPLSRREQREQERLAEIEQHRTEAQQARDELAKFQAEREEAQRTAYQSLNFERFGELQEKYEAFKKIGYDPDQYMDVDELAEYKALVPQHANARALLEVALQGVRATDQAALTEEIKAQGLNPSEYIGIDSATVAKRVAAATEARVRSESADRIAQLEASEQSLATKLGGRGKSVGPGGQSDAASRHVGQAWDPQKRGADNLEASLEKAFEVSAPA